MTAHWTEPGISKIKPGSFYHASFTYVLTATTSPILHVCRESKKSDFSKKKKKNSFIINYGMLAKLGLTMGGFITVSLHYDTYTNQTTIKILSYYLAVIVITSYLNQMGSS